MSVLQPAGDSPGSSDVTENYTPGPAEAPELIGRYQILAKLGAGGMGSVYLAHDPVMGRQVALKVIAPKWLNEPAALARFRREIQVISKVHHPQIVSAFDADLGGDFHFLVMEYVPGTDLGRLVKQSGPLPVAAAADYAQQAALGLQHAHEARLVHRDIKPSNLLLGPGGRVKIADLGLARLADEAVSDQHTQSGSTLGTPDYMAPEQADDPRNADIRADIYSLGCTLYQLLTGRVPFPVAGYASKLVAHQKVEPRPAEELRPDLPSGLGDVVRKMMAKAPDDRHQTPAEVAAALRPYARRDADGLVGVRLPETTFDSALGPARREGGDLPPTLPASEAAERWSGASGLATAGANRPPPSTVVGTLTPGGRRWVSRRTAAALAAVVAVAAVALLLVWNGTSVTTGSGGRPSPVKTPVQALAPVAGTDVGKDAGTNPAVTVPAAPDLAPLVINSIGMKLAAIRPGTFLMGSPEAEPLREPKEGPQHRVTISRPFYLGVYEVTQGEYADVMGENPSFCSPEGPGAPLVEGIDTRRMPVEMVTWSDARRFCERLSGREAEVKAGREYRLPTEAEWEYGCRAGTTTPFSFGDRLTAVEANFNGVQPYGGVPAGSPSRCPVPVASFPPNAFGLYDMHGNVAEWCGDVLGADSREKCGPACGYYTEAPRTDPRVESPGGQYRVGRGGAFSLYASECRSAARAFWVPRMREYFVGFRVACVLKASTNPPR